VANPGRFAWRAGLRLRDIIPDKESLVTRDYWAKRNRLGFFAPEFTAPEASRNAVTVEIDGPQINWSYAVIERRQERDLSTELVPFGLGKLVLDRDETENRELRPGDVVTIFSQSDLRVAAAQQTRFVRLEGEFRAAGIYPVADGETLGNLIERAGGLTSQAYLFGAEFLRESARAGQQLRLDQFVRELEHAVERGGTTRLDGAVSPEEAATVTARLESERRMVERLRGVKATGRIVLHLPPEGSDLSKIAGMQLENGDRFVVPSRPATVNVLGAVYNQNSFLHEPQLRIADYLRQAGGPTRAADRAHIFVIRADGSVVPKQGSGIFTRPFEADRLNPGDSIVVPEAIFKSGVLRGLRDWTQVFAQLALGAAAINVLR
jgi:protein involved in polysaccharide export with SLBB domain